MKNGGSDKNQEARGFAIARTAVKISVPRGIALICAKMSRGFSELCPTHLDFLQGIAQSRRLLDGRAYSTAVHVVDGQLVLMSLLGSPVTKGFLGASLLFRRPVMGGVTMPSSCSLRLPVSHWPI